MLLITADDYGITSNYSKVVLDLVSDGLINSVSVIVNSDEFESFAKELDPYLGIMQINCHLNIVEGKSISLKEGSILVNSEGYFHRDIKSFFLFYIFSRRDKRKLILTEILGEFEAQLTAFKSVFPNVIFSLDSHQHIHLLPFIHPIVNELGVKFSCSSIRLGISKTSTSNISLKILFRSLIFNLLARKARRKSSLPLRSGVVLGVNELNNWSGKMFNKIYNCVESNKATDFELVSHPAWKEAHEISDLDPQVTFTKHYTSESRRQEHALIKQNILTGLLK